MQNQSQQISRVVQSIIGGPAGPGGKVNLGESNNIVFVAESQQLREGSNLS